MMNSMRVKVVPYTPCTDSWVNDGLSALKFQIVEKFFWLLVNTKRISQHIYMSFMNFVKTYYDVLWVIFLVLYDKVKSKKCMFILLPEKNINYEL